MRNLRAFTIACCPLPFGACPHHTLDRLCRTCGFDTVEDTLLQTLSNLVDEWLEHLGVGRLDQLGRCETLRLCLQRHAAQIGFDALAEREVQTSVYPGGNSVGRTAGLVIGVAAVTTFVIAGLTVREFGNSINAVPVPRVP